MEDLGKRAALTYGFLSIAIWFLKLSMQESGANSIGNPAWTLVSGIYTLFKWSWWILIACSIVLLIVFVITLIIEHLSEQKRQQEIRIQAIEERVRQDQRRAREALREKEEEKTRQLQKQQAEIEQKRREDEYWEYVRRRSPREAVLAALKDFCGGD